MPKKILSKIDNKSFAKVIKKSTSIGQVLKHFGLKPAGGNYITVKSRIKKLGLNASHFLGQGHLKGKKHNWSIKIELAEILIDNSTYVSSNHLRKRLIKEKYFKPKCYCCNRAKWRGKPISLELEHINGKRNDNRINNLTLLCPNCHAQTPTYRGRNNKK